MLPFDSLSGITTFVVAAKASSFTAAADQLGLSKSAVGKSIARLEARLGVQLFHRTTRHLTLTADGEAYFSACSVALQEIAAAETSLTSATRKPAGRLRIDMPIAFGRKVMLPIILKIAKKYPELQLTLTFNDHLIDPIEDGVDLSIRFGEPKESYGLVARRLTRQRWIICASPDYLVQHGPPESLDDLQKHCGIVGHRHGQPLSWRINPSGTPIRFSPPATHQLSDGVAMIEATLAGLGLCQMPASLFRQYLDEGRLVSVLDDLTQDLVDVHAVWPKVAHLQPKVRQVVDELIALGQAGALD